MNQLVMIPIDMIHPHPDNPRKDLGDLNDLSASIKESGLLQNLTVIEGSYQTEEEFNEVFVAEVEFLSPRSNERYPESDIEREQRQQAAQYQAFETIEDDDLPFK